MTAIQVIQLLVAVVDAAAQLSNSASQLGQLLSKAQAEGRDLTPEEVQAVADATGASRAALVAAIETAAVREAAAGS